MGILEQIGDAAKNIGAATGDFVKQVSGKADHAIEIKKLEAKISKDKTAIRKEMKKISSLLFDKFSKGEEIPEDIKEFCENIKLHFSSIDKLNEEIEKVKNAVVDKVEDVKEAVKDGAEEVKEKAEKTKKKTAETIKKAEKAVKGKVKEVKKAVEEKDPEKEKTKKTKKSK